MKNLKPRYVESETNERFETAMKQSISKKTLENILDSEVVEGDDELLEIFKVKKDKDVPVEIVCHLKKGSINMELMKKDPYEMIQGMIEIGMHLNANKGVFYVDSREEDFLEAFQEFSNGNLKKLTQQMGFEIAVKKVEKYKYQGDVSLLRKDGEKAIYPFEEINDIYQGNDYGRKYRKVHIDYSNRKKLYENK